MATQLDSTQLAPGIQTVYEYTSASFTNADMLALHTPTPLTVLPALGAGLVALVQDMVFICDSSAGFYGNATNSGIIARYIGGDDIVYLQNGGGVSATSLNKLLAATAGGDMVRTLPLQMVFDASQIVDYSGYELASVANVGIEIYLDGPQLSGGHANNYLKVITSYRVIDTN